MKFKAVEIFGWYGALAIVTAYLLVSFSVIEATDILYQLLNGTGAVAIVLVSIHHKNYQPAVLNIVWTIIALIALLKIIF